MLEHLVIDASIPTRVIIMGAGGFLGSAMANHMKHKGIPVLGLTPETLNLLEMDAPQKLAGILRPDDTLVVVSAMAPCKDNMMFIQNIMMMAAVCSAIEKTMPAHVVYISSDAVYADDTKPLTEDSCAEPSSLHGVMHLAREIMLKGSCGAPLAILRPSLIYGAADTHNGYGPNQFRRLAAKGKDIVLFGEGEEQRDHVLIDDVAEIVRLVVIHRSKGVLNVATGDVASFRKVAEMVASHFNPPPAITTTPRKGPMPHRGYRPFDISACGKAFPEFRYTSLAEGLVKTHKLMMGAIGNG
jgi:UDP-glucose 4-epimerase